MLDRSKVLQEIQKFSDSLFFDYTQELILAKQIWSEISDKPDFNDTIKNIQTPWILPNWEGCLGKFHKINRSSEYCVLATDGSQIYPDRHQGTSCFLINIGTTLFTYGQNSSVEFNSVPFVFASDKNSDSVEIVDCKRQELEFQLALDIIAAKQLQTHENFIFLFDGSLIFWHLESKSANIGQEYLSKYLGALHQFYMNKILIAGYISLPKSKELINLIRAQLCISDKPTNTVDHLVDTQIVNFYLEPGTRTILFKNNSKISSLYPNHLQPYFFYLDVGDEIVRIEVPAWIANDEQKILKIAGIVIDQTTKGYGYPVCLSEAHEQAVVKGPDRDFFYYLLQKLSISNKQTILSSQKSIKKRLTAI